MLRYLLILTTFSLVSCTADKLPTPVSNSDFCSTMTITYDEHIDSLLTRTCSYASCHDGNSGLSPILSYGDLPEPRRNIAFERMVLDKDMPPSYATTTLSKEQIDTIKCWKDQGYLEN